MRAVEANAFFSPGPVVSLLRDFHPPALGCGASAYRTAAAARVPLEDVSFAFFNKGEVALPLRTIQVAAHPFGRELNAFLDRHLVVRLITFGEPRPKCRPECRLHLILAEGLCDET